MRPCHVPRSRRKAVRAEDLSANGTDELLLPVAAKAVDQLREEAPSEFGGKYSGQVETSKERLVLSATINNESQELTGSSQQRSYAP